MTLPEVINNTSKRIEKLKRIKLGLMQDLFHYGIDEKGQMCREATRRFKNTDLGMIPEDLNSTTVGEVLAKRILLDIQDGNHGELHPKTTDFVDDGIPFIMATDI